MKNYIQIGTNIGMDDFFKEMSKMQDPCRIFLIEANMNLISAIHECYRELMHRHEVHILNVGIVPDRSITEFIIDTALDSRGTGLSSFLDRKSHQLSGYRQTVQVKTFQDLCFEEGIKDVELLLIDTEGCDYSIIESIDLQSINIHRVQCEVWPYDSDDRNGRIQTGPTYFKEAILPKMQNYSHEVRPDSTGCNNHFFVKLLGR
jgi:FkbM family methyltransferase